MEQPNAGSLASGLARHHLPERDVVRLYRTFYAGAPAFRAESETHHR
jgi:hypothetical protein